MGRAALRQMLSSLSEHTTQHTTSGGEREQNKCNQCECVFAWKGDLRKHMYSFIQHNHSNNFENKKISAKQPVAATI